MVVASQFNNFTGIGPPEPDFSSSGGPMQLGYFASNGVSGGGAQSTTDSGIDNWSVTLVSAPPGVPALGPAWLGALALALTVTGARRAAVKPRERLMARETRKNTGAAWRPGEDSNPRPAA